MPDSDVLGYWVFYFLIAAAIILGTMYWFGSVRDDTATEAIFLREDLRLLFKTMKTMDGNITVSYPLNNEYGVRMAGNNLLLTKEKDVNHINVFDSGKVSVFRRDDFILIEKNG